MSASYNLNDMEEPIVSVEQGRLKGKTEQLYGSNGKYYAFLGIPYARPPLGELRFKEPQAPDSWEGIRDATVEGNPCYSRHIGLSVIVGDEDCLFLNVYTPELLGSRSRPLKPVMVWIHGGGFTAGSGNNELYGPDFLLAHDVVVVTINYRLGLLGFLSLEDSSLEVPGNAGLKDMVLALVWVQRNITQFCGDPNNVTIFGESAGGVSVACLMLSPLAKGLFHKAIMQSGSAINPWSVCHLDIKELSNLLGILKPNEKEVLDALRALPVNDVLKLQEKLRDPFNASEKRPFGPVVERPPTKTSIISADPIDIIASGSYNKVPVLIGYCKDEGIFSEAILTKIGKEPIHSDFEVLIHHKLELKKGSNVSKSIANKIKEFYYPSQKSKIDPIQAFYNLESDTKFIRGIYSTAKNLVATGTSPVFFYRFSVNGELNMCKHYHIPRKAGVAHADELGYLWKTMLTPDLEPGSLEQVTVHRMTKLWTNFARNGNPNSTTRDPVIDVVWKPVEKDTFNYLDIGEKLKALVDPEKERMAFWDSIFKAHPASSKL